MNCRTVLSPPLRYFSPLTARDRGQAPVQGNVDAIIDEGDTAVTQREMGPAVVPTEERVIASPIISNRFQIVGLLAIVQGDTTRGAGAVEPIPPRVRTPSRHRLADGKRV